LIGKGAGLEKANRLMKRAGASVPIAVPLR
jgi:hypothetical protein